MRPGARLRRTYFECRYGQLHVLQAIPPGGGFDEATALLCIPGSRGVGRFFQNLLAPLGANRSIYAPDLPGYGESDSAGTAAGDEQCALAFVDLLDSLRQRRVDVLAHAEGLGAAMALEKMRPGSLLRRCVFSAASRAQLAQARHLQLQFRELTLALPGDEAITAESADLQCADLIGIFGDKAP